MKFSQLDTKIRYIENIATIDHTLSKNNFQK